MPAWGSKLARKKGNTPLRRTPLTCYNEGGRRVEPIREPRGRCVFSRPSAVSHLQSLPRGKSDDLTDASPERAQSRDVSSKSGSPWSGVRINLSTAQRVDDQEVAHRTRGFPDVELRAILLRPTRV